MERRRGEPGGAREQVAAGQQQSQPRQVIRWERFLPRRSLRVLLVESDDSTRHIVAALLRKCSYSVSAVADGKKAWEVLKEKEYRFDLVLTEVEMPSLSGIGLLSNITSCDLSRNIPVVMMSSQDSVTVVFNCMRKGAVDFLVKPLRRNELRNLWQHVWRKHYSISHLNGCESMNDNQMKSEDMFGTNAATNHVIFNTENGLRTDEMCSEEDDSQSSSCEPETKSQTMQRHEDLMMSEARESSMAITRNLEKQLSDKILSENALRKPLVTDGRNESLGNRDEASILVQETVVTDKNQGHDGVHDRSPMKREHLAGREETVGDSESHLFFPENFPQNKIINVIEPVVNGVCNHAAFIKDISREKCPCGEMKSPCDSNVTTSGALPSWELPVRGLNLNSGGKQGFQESHVLKQSAASAFSRYDGSGIRNSCQKLEFSPSKLCAATNKGKNQSLSCNGTDKEEVASCPWRLMSHHSNEAQVIRCHQVSSDSIEDADHFGADPSKEVTGVFLSSTDNDNPSKVLHPTQLRLMSFPFPVGQMPFHSVDAGYGAMMQPLFYSNLSPYYSSAAKTAKKFLPSEPVSHHGNHLDYDDLSKQNCHPCHPEQVIRDETVDRELGNPQRVICADIEETDQSSSFRQNVLNSGGSNGNGQMMEAGLGTVVGIERGSENGFQNCNIKGLECMRSQREAALIKFRLKRKERCFEKKVRYQSRKKLAETRPRIKGQFVRQLAIIPAVVTAEEEDNCDSYCD